MKIGKLRQITLYTPRFHPAKSKILWGMSSLPPGEGVPAYMEEVAAMGITRRLRRGDATTIKVAS